MQSSIAIEELMLFCVFSVVRIITILFYFVIIHYPKFKTGQGQTYVILLLSENA